MYRKKWPNDQTLFNNISGIGGGKSKKEAKQNTARSVLNQLLGVKDDTPQPVKSSVNKDTNHVNGWEIYIFVMLYWKFTYDILIQVQFDIQYPA